MKNPSEFFRKKRPWSKYKDLILDYYLEPYLAKVARLRRPILVVDCFAGPGRFDDGQPGSPLIISRRLEDAQRRSAEVLGFYVEKDCTLHAQLVKNTREIQVPARTRCGDFREHIAEIADLARDHTVFIYLDPIKPSDLLFADMECVYRQLQHGRSVEVLINFMSKGFLRAARGLGSQILLDRSGQNTDERVRRWDSVAGGTFWRDIVGDNQAPNIAKIEQLAKGYAKRLNAHFEWVLSYPVRDKYEDTFPKYHLTFGSRHTDAIELMNRAMVKARREFVGTRFVDGCLFDCRPEAEVIDPQQIELVVLTTCRAIGRTTWKNLRVRATVANPCTYTDSEINGAIKRAIQTNRIASDATGRRIEEHAHVWPVS